MAQPFIQKPVNVTPDIEAAWLRYKQEHPEATFGAFVRKLLEEALCVTDAPTSTIP